MCTIAMIIWAIFHPAGERTFATVSAAMAPTLILGDTVVMVPYSDGAEPQRGDVVAFLDRGDGATVHVFRVIGLPGDTVRLDAGVVVLDGVPLAREPIGEVAVDFGYEFEPAELWRETLPGGAAFDTLDSGPDGVFDDTADFTAPAGHYFVLGDNRDNANDSRGIYGGAGYVPAGNILGRIDGVLSSCKPDGRFLADRTGLAIGPRG